MMIVKLYYVMVKTNKRSGDQVNSGIGKILLNTFDHYNIVKEM